MDTIFRCDLQQMYPMSFANTFLKKSKTTRPLKVCAPKEDDCGTNTKACSPQYLNDRLRTECPSDLSRIRQCWLRNEYLNPSCKDTYQVAQCYGKKRLDALSCISKFEENCRSYRLTATKVHRLSMQAVEEIILKIPDVYIIFYIRDPRGMWMSREDRDHGVPMKALCQQMLNDYNLFVQLDNKFPGVFIKVKYEEYAERPIEVAKSIYEHIQETFTQKLFVYIEKITSTGKVKREDPTNVRRSDSNRTASAWRNTMSDKVLKNANKVCNDFLLRANYPI